MSSLYLNLSFLSLYLLIVAVVVINFSLECFTNLDIAYISYSTHILFNYKLVLAFCNWVSKHSLVFYTLIELSIGIRAGAFVVVSLPKCDPRPLLRWIDLNHLMLLHTLMGATMHFGKSV